MDNAEDDLKKAYDLAESLDTLLCDTLHFAFDKDLGYLTECPTNLGTGLRASVMLHLPALENSGEIFIILYICIYKDIAID